MTRVAFLLACGAAMAVANCTSQPLMPSGMEPGSGGAAGAQPGSGGSAGATGPGGAVGAGGTPGSAGTSGTGRQGPGGISGTGGDIIGTGGIMGIGGVMGAGGTVGTGGVAGMGGAPGGAGGTGGQEPCAGLCAPAIVFTLAPTSPYVSPQLGLQAACYETTSFLDGGGCSNIAPPRTFSVNGTPESCDGSLVLPARRNGGYCFQASAGGVAYAVFFAF